MTNRAASYGWERWPERKTLDGVFYLCRWCAKQLSGRQTAYCSKECQAEVYTRCVFANLSRAIYSRDKGICQTCGLNLENLEDFFRWYEKTFRKYSTNPPGESKYRYSMQYNSIAWIQHWPYPQQLKQDLGFSQNHLSETNHKKALAEGGDPVDPDNLETLCIPCHKKHTAALRKRLAKNNKNST